MQKVKVWEIALFMAVCAGIIIACELGYNSVVPAY